MASDLDDIPDYAKEWGLDVKRVKNLPENYDVRVLKDSIFVFIDERKEENFVILKPCEKCKYTKQFCNSAYPTCDRCDKSGSKCRFPDMSWRGLPKNKRLWGATRIKLEARHSSWEDKDIIIPDSDHDTPRRNRFQRKAQIPSYALLIAQNLHLNELESPVEVKENEAASGSTPKRRRGRPRKQKIEDDDFDPLEETQRNDRQELIDSCLMPTPSPKKMKKVGRDRDATTSSIKTKLKTLGSGKKRARNQMLNEDEDDDDDVLQDDLENFARQSKKRKSEKGLRSLTWTSAHPDTPSRLIPRKNRNKLKAMPRIWCSSYNDLMSALPELNHLTNGICVFNRDVPIILLDGHAWHDDVWDGRILEITLARNITCPEDCKDKFWEDFADIETTKPSASIGKNKAQLSLSTEFNRLKSKSPSMEISQNDGGETIIQNQSLMLLPMPLSNLGPPNADEIANTSLDNDSTGTVNETPQTSLAKKKSFEVTQEPTPPSSCNSSPHLSEEQQSDTNLITVSIEDFNCLSTKDNVQRRKSTPVSTPARIPTPPPTPTPSKIRRSEREDPMNKFVKGFLIVSNKAYDDFNRSENNDDAMVDDSTCAETLEETDFNSQDTRISDLESITAAAQPVAISIDDVNNMELYELEDQEIPPSVTSASHVEVEYRPAETVKEIFTSSSGEVTTSTEVETSNHPKTGPLSDKCNLKINQPRPDSSTSTANQEINSSFSVRNDISFNPSDEKNLTSLRFAETHLSKVSGEHTDCPTASLTSENILPNNAMTRSEMPVQGAKHLEKYPDDIRSLYEAVNHGMPTSIIVSSSWALLPFVMHKDVQMAFLGFFHVIHIKTFATPFLKIQKKGTNFIKGQIRWRIRLQWAEGGEPSSAASPTAPFWSSSSTSTTALSTHPLSQNTDMPAIAPLISPKEIGLFLLPQYLYASESQWWHCTECGKLNLTGWMGKHLCTFCPRDQHNTRINNNSVETMPVLEADDVRDALRCSPNTHPDVRYSENVYNRMIYWPNGIRTFKYFIGEESNLKVLKYIYTCNIPDLEKDCNKFFKSFQTDVDLELKQSLDKSDPGAQYTYYVIPDDYITNADNPFAGTSTWQKVPETLRETRQFMVEYANDRIRPKDLIKNFLFCDVVAWRYSKAKEVATIRAESSSHPVFLLCLGADVDLHINRVTHKAQKKAGPEVMDVDTISSENHVINNSPEKKTTELSLQISLSHGCMIVISGCELEYKLTAKEFSIIIKGYYDSSQIS